jgi:hypothetical protein
LTSKITLASANEYSEITSVRMDEIAPSPLKTSVVMFWFVLYRMLLVLGARL